MHSRTLALIVTLRRAASVLHVLDDLRVCSGDGGVDIMRRADDPVEVLTEGHIGAEELPVHLLRRTH